MSLAQNFTIVGGATLASRITGFVRDMLVAATLGASAIADAYVAAFLIPNLFRRLVGEGAFNAAYVPMFARREAEGGAKSAEAFAEAALSLLLGFGILILLVAEFQMPLVISMVAPGFINNPEKFRDAVEFGRILFPFVAIILLVAVFTGTLNALGRYAIASWAPVLLNVFVIIALGFAIYASMRGTRDAGFVLVWTVVVAGLVNLVIVAVAVWRNGYKLLPHVPRFDADLRRLMLIALPGIAVAGAGHINVVVAAQLSSSVPSAVSWLYFAERIFQLPLGFVAAAIGVVLLPAVARHLANGDVGAAREAESRALEFGLLITLPAAIALALLAKPIVSILYERGAFLPTDSNAVAASLRALAYGLPAFVLVKVFLPAFLAREDMKGPLIAASLGIFANIAVALTLFPHLGPVAAAIGVSASALTNATALYILLLRNGRFRPDRLARKRLPRVLLASVMTGLLIWLLQEFLRPYMKTGQPTIIRVGSLGLICSMTVVCHLAFIHILKAADLSQIRLPFRKQPD
ncbi:MAG: murein biosynthesis integral membrane protein MurJ [Beijerinckiaceae bacterium]